MHISQKKILEKFNNPEESGTGVHRGHASRCFKFVLNQNLAKTKIF